MAGLAGASVPLVFLISLVGLVATAASLALFSGVYPSAGSFLTYIARAIRAVWVIPCLRVRGPCRRLLASRIQRSLARCRRKFRPSRADAFDCPAWRGAKR
jgi:hypothetical protein